MKTILRLKTKVLLLSISILIMSCSKDEEISQKDDSNTNNQTIVNPNPSQNNNEILFQNIWGAKSSIYEAIEYNNSTYSIGQTNGSPTISQINFSGIDIWNKQIGFSGRDILINKNYIIVAGGIDTNSDSFLDRGKIKTYDLNGNVKNEITITKSGYDRVVFNAITKMDPNTNPNRIAIAGFVVNSSAIQYPFIKFVDIDNDGNIITTTTNELVITTQPKSRAVSIAFGQNNVFILTNNYTQLPDEVTNCSILKFAYRTPITGNSNPGGGIGDSTPPPTSADKLTKSLNVIEFKSKVDINQDNGLKLDASSGKSLVLRLNNLYVFLSAEALKDPAPSGGGYWESGYVVNITGADDNLPLNIAWKKQINITNKTDRVYEGTVFNGAIYAIGHNSSVKYTSSNIQFSNGLLTKLDLNGNVIYNKTFGDKTTSSGFNTLFEKDGILFLYGYTNYHNGIDSQNWFVKINP